MDFMKLETIPYKVELGIKLNKWKVRGLNLNLRKKTYVIVKGSKLQVEQLGNSLSPTKLVKMNLETKSGQLKGLRT